MQRSRELAALFERAKALVDTCGYRPEYEHQRSIIGTTWLETDFLREYSWVVLCCGFREQVVRRWFSYISMSFFDFTSAQHIAEHRGKCRELALAAINNRPKVDAIIDTAERLSIIGFSEFYSAVLDDPIAQLTKLPYIGSVTCSHLMKNLGFDVAKNDRHLERISRRLQFADAHLLCEQISGITGEPMSVVDAILWRFAELSSRHAMSAVADTIPELAPSQG